MKIIKRTVDNVVILNGNDLLLDNNGSYGAGWKNATITDANHVLETVTSIPADYIPGAFSYLNGAWNRNVAGSDFVFNVRNEFVKFQPGHVVKLIDWMRTNTSELAIIESELAATPALRAVQVVVFWADVEKFKGVYDFAMIDDLLSRFSALGKGLYITLQTKVFGFTQKPAPDYLLTDAFDGGVYEYASDGSLTVPKGMNLKLWNSAVVSALAGFLKVLGERYNNHPNFMGIGFPETSWSPETDGTTVITQAQQDTYYANLLEINKCARLYFPSSIVYQFVNYPRTILKDFTQSLKENGIAMGGPDIFPDEFGLTVVDNPNIEDGVYSYYPKLSNHVPLMPSVQPTNYINTAKDGSSGHVPTITELNAFGRDNLKANNIFWSREPTYWPSVLTFLNEAAQTADAAGGLSAIYPNKYYK